MFEIEDELAHEVFSRTFTATNNDFYEYLSMKAHEELDELYPK